MAKRTMAKRTMALVDYLRQVGAEPDFLREGVRPLTKLAMGLETEDQIGAGLYERSPERTTQRNGYRPRNWTTRVGDVPLAIPKLRQGTYYPSFLDPRRPAEKALLAVVQQVYLDGVSTRKVDDLYLKVRQNHRIVSRALVIAMGVRETGEREVIGFALGASEEQAFWRELLRSLVRRGLHGVLLVVSDAQEGLKAAQMEVLGGASWQRCRVHFMRNMLAHIPKGDKTVVAAVLRTIFAQGSRASAGQQLEQVVGFMSERWPRAAELLESAEDDILAHMAFPSEHWAQIYSTNPLERLNKEAKRRTNVVGIFPDDESTLRLAGAVLKELDDDWQVGRRYFSLESMNKLQIVTAVPILLQAAGPLRLEPVR